MICLMLLASPAWPHLMPAQQGTVNVLDNAAFVVLALPLSAVPGADDNGDGRLSETELRAHRSDIHGELMRRFRLYDGSRQSRVDFLQVSSEPDERLAESDSIASGQDAGARYFLVLMKHSFDMPPAALRVETDFFGTAPDERQLTIKAVHGTEKEVAVLSPLRSGHRFFRGPWQLFADYVLAGAEHILLGADHLLFLLTIVVGAAGWRYWLAVITSFTVAHSITLTLSLFGAASAPASVVEPLIAASIASVAALNLWRRAESAPRRIVIVFVCGLLHGLGFASAIAEMGIDDTHRVMSVVGFNLGVEAGQAMFLMVLLLLGGVFVMVTSSRCWRGFWHGRRAVHFSARQGFSMMALLAGSVWFVQRLFAYS